ncbi:MAG: winged helix-turn-helix transcriptional regulator [Chloroflexi bacterium]|nr:winged helix-turn-helix transcriptional regulator [Acidobacteriota bacterium]MCA1587973.1 winged helix-turn-helix transcriptional regulator [Chloroflexota bacterium]MCA1719548.1 winged helix-turn-helix transcriptional regulator [Actinomycetota bacterium]
MTTGRRDYGQFCGLAAGLKIVGERWTFLVIRELMINPARFNEILENLPGIGPNLLADRLRMLTEHGVIEQLPVPGDARGRLYRLTEAGQELRRPLLALAKWGMRFLDEDDRAGVVRADWAFLAIQAMIVEDKIPDVDQVYEFRVGENIFTIKVHGGEVGFQRGSVSLPDLTIRCDPDTFVRIGARMLTPFDAIVAGDVKIEGEAEVIHRCTRMLGLTA